MRTVFFNGRVYTGGWPLASAFAVDGDEFIFAGGDAEALALARPEDGRVDLGGRFVCAGFNDSHMHLLSYGLALRRAKLNEHTGSLKDLVDYFRGFAANGPNERGWLVGRGWNQDLFSDTRRMPNRFDLDEVSREYPVAAVRCCGHCAVVNSKAIELLGLAADTKVPGNGVIGAENGEPDGRLYEEAIGLIWAGMPQVGKEDVKDMIRAACRRYSACGVTSCQSDDYATPWRMVNEAYRELIAAGELTVRVNEQCNFGDAGSLMEFIGAGNAPGTGDNMFRVGPLKMVADGSLGSRTAFMSRPYADDPSTRGVAVYSQETLDEVIGCAHERGMNVAIHAIGDACLDRVLNAVEKAMAKHPRADCRHGIVHCQITRRDQLERMARLNMHIYAQTVFLDYDSRIVRARVGDLADTSYSWKTLMNMGLTVSNGTDCPVELPDALRGIQCAVTRAPLSGGEPYLPGEAFTVREALDSYTSAGARASFEENRKGRIAPGMLADFVVLGGNPFDTPAEELSRIPVRETWLGGRRVYAAD
ncbi:MAG: amidohydrolase [Clostridia bacterium]|nr:amidohydrolase [Clostridia bacterium]